MCKTILESFLTEELKTTGNFTFLVGAGLSAESGIPTFRGKEGYWKVGSVNYEPQEIGTFEFFKKDPIEVWKWYLFRKTVCRKAIPNKGHLALKSIEDKLKGRFKLISQNVDGLHNRVGQLSENTYLIHGDLTYARCSNECTNELYPFPDNFGDKDRNSDLSESEQEELRCRKCGSWLRPHVLWFDEFYNEKYYKMNSALESSYNTDVLFVIGTSGATNLPNQVVQNVVYNNCLLVDINIAENPFQHLASSYKKGYAIQESSSLALQELSSML